MPQPTRHRTWLRRALIVLVALIGSYLLVVNLALNLGFVSSLVHRNPDRLDLRWRWAATWFPGVVQLWDVDIKGQTRTVQWRAQLERARLDVNLPALLLRQFRSSHLDGSGLRFYLRRTTEATSSLAPPIPGLGVLDTRRPVADRPPGWILDFDSIAIRDVREVWIGTSRYVGDGRLDGDLRFQIRGPLEVGDSTIELVSGDLFGGPGEQRPLAHQVQLRLEGRLAELVPRRDRGRAVLGFLTGTLDLAAETKSLGFANAYLERVPNLRLGGAGSLDGHLRIARGTVRPGSHLRLHGDPVQVHFLGSIAEGEGNLRADVEDGGGTISTRLVVAIPELTVRRSEAGRPPHIEGHDLTLKATGGVLELHRGRPHLDLELALPSAELTDITAYNAYLPPGTGFELLSGKGQLNGYLELSTSKAGGKGQLSLSADDVTARFDEVELTGGLELEAHLSNVDLATRRFEVDGTQLAVTGVRWSLGGEAARDAGWWARIEIPDGALRTQDQPQVDAEVRLRLSDVAPLLWVVGDKRPLVRWIGNLVDFRDVHAGARFRLDDSIDLRDVKVTATPDLEVLGDVSLGKDERWALFYARLGVLATAVRIDGQERDLHLLQPRRWFEEQRRARRSSAEP